MKRLLAAQYFCEETWQKQMSEMLYGVSGSDPVTFISIALLLAIIALVACWLPAHRAAQVDPQGLARGRDRRRQGRLEYFRHDIGVEKDHSASSQALFRGA